MCMHVCDVNVNEKERDLTSIDLSICEKTVSKRRFKNQESESLDMILVSI